MGLFGNNEEKDDKKSKKEERSYTLKELRELSKIFRAPTKKKKD